MAVRPIVTYDDDVLRETAKPVSKDNPQVQQLIDDLFDTMYNANGVGLAAPQVGVPLRIFVVDADPMAEESDEKMHGPMAMINPEIVSESEETVEIEEGCLSIPEVNGKVTRPESVRVRFFNRDFEERELDVSGWLARVVQHEKDHLDGVLFIDYLSSFKRKLLGSRLKEIAEGEKETDYPVVSKKAVSN